MNTAIINFIINTNQIDWKPLTENGITYPGIFVKSLKYDNEGQRSPTILLKFEAGAEYPYHSHPAGEEIFVLDGACTIEGAQLKAGDYLYTPPGFKHAVISSDGCTMFL